MRFVTFSLKGQVACGVLLHDKVVDLQRAYRAFQSHDGQRDELALAERRVPLDLQDLLHGGDTSMAAAREALALAADGRGSSDMDAICHALPDIELLPPIRRPGKLIGVGLNFRSHLLEIGEAAPEYPILFTKACTSLIGSGQTIVLPRVSRQVDYEGELAVVIGRRGKYIREEDALWYVAGYTCANDVSAHDIEFRTSQWTSGKILDTFCPLGPALVTPDELPDPGSLHLTTMRNGRTVQAACTSEMVFSVPFLISYISSLATLEPGDVILTGTPAGIGCNQSPQVFLQDGDQISVHIDGIGTLTNPVVAEADHSPLTTRHSPPIGTLANPTVAEAGGCAMRPWVAKRLSSQRESVFEESSALARRYGAVNLGSGTPEMPVPDSVLAAAADAIAGGHNQYAPVRGEAALREAVAAHAARFYDQELDPSTEVTITSGVTEAIHAAIFACVDPGDEVIVFEPFYDCYVPSIRAAGGIPIPVTLHAPSFRFDPPELRAAFSPRTRALLLNTPHNPTGTVFSRAELSLIAELCQEFDVLALSDEVYEHIVFDGAEHVRLATLPGMSSRTLTLGGAGKTFSCTGWRIGWAIGPAPLHEALCRLRQFTVFATATPFQFAIAAGLQEGDAYFQRLAAEYQARRDFLVDALAACGLRPTRPAGGFFILTDIFSFPHADGREFCNDLARDFGVVPVPTDTFYLHPSYGERIARFTFCPRWEALETAARRLAKLPTARWANR
jgi:N-succinyldiaminopimelate aminotransferase